MRARSFLLCLFGSLLSGLLFMNAFSHASESAPVILCLGDSLTAGFGVMPGEDYPALLQQRLRAHGFAHRVINAGLSGDTTAGAMRRLDWSLRSQPKIAIVVLGANDGLRGLDLAEMKQNLLTIMTRLRQAKVELMLLGGMQLPPNYGAGYDVRFQAIYPEVAEETGATLIPFFLEGVAGQPHLNQSDGIHPTAAGYRIIAEHVWRHLLPWLNGSSSSAASGSSP
ncbi:MAG: arylesterase [Magnetococcales bacterium]|nr:arylesterase [Magnetococcales bacterium]NGZ06740.1 arylesterase [Magnetococcales bacterium]